MIEKATIKKRSEVFPQSSQSEERQRKLSFVASKPATHRRVTSTTNQPAFFLLQSPTPQCPGICGDKECDRSPKMVADSMSRWLAGIARRLTQMNGILRQQHFLIG